MVGTELTSELTVFRNYQGLPNIIATERRLNQNAGLRGSKVC